MTRLVWTVTAQRDLRTIRDYIARDSKVIARRFVNRIKKSATALIRWPESGSLRRQTISGTATVGSISIRRRVSSKHIQRVISLGGSSDAQSISSIEQTA